MNEKSVNQSYNGTKGSLSVSKEKRQGRKRESEGVRGTTAGGRRYSSKADDFKRNYSPMDPQVLRLLN